MTNQSGEGEGSKHTGGGQAGDLMFRAQIRQAITAYFDAVQRRDWAAVTATFVPWATLDYGTPDVRDVAENIRLLQAGTERLSSSSTIFGMHSRIHILGETAKSETSAFTTHCPLSASDDRARMSSVRYEDEWICCDDGRWRITKRTCHHEFRGWLPMRPPRTEADPA